MWCCMRRSGSTVTNEHGAGTRSPFDIVYRLIQAPRSPTRLIFRMMESIDVMTTVRAKLGYAHG